MVSYNMNNIYTINPHNVVFDEKIAGFNESKGTASYNSLLMQIQEYGQQEPIIMRNNLCLDGRHRTQICIELNIDVKAIDVAPDLKDEDAIVLCNSNIFGGRNNSATQLAIKAFMLVEQFGMTDIKAVSLTGLVNKKAIGFVRRIKASKLNKELKILDKLLEGEVVKVGERTSKSIEVIKKEIVKLEEEEFMKTKIEIKTPKVDYNNLLETELARDKFWLMQLGMTMEAKLQLVGVLNALYIIDEVKYQNSITDEDLEFINDTNKKLDSSSKQVKQIVKNHLIEKLTEV